MTNDTLQRLRALRTPEQPMTKEKRARVAVARHLVQAIEAAHRDLVVQGKLTSGQAAVNVSNILITAVAVAQCSLFGEDTDKAPELVTWITQTIEEWHDLANAAGGEIRPETLTDTK